MPLICFLDVAGENLYLASSAFVPVTEVLDCLTANLLLTTNDASHALALAKALEFKEGVYVLPVNVEVVKKLARLAGAEAIVREVGTCASCDQNHGAHLVGCPELD